MTTGTNPLLLLAELRAMGEAVVTPDVTTLPELEDLAPTDCHISWDVTLITGQSRDMVERSEEHTSELQSLMRISYAVFCLKHTTNTPPNYNTILNNDTY